MKQAEVVEIASSFRCCPVNSDSSWRKTQIEIYNMCDIWNIQQLLNKCKLTKEMFTILENLKFISHNMSIFINLKVYFVKKTVPDSHLIVQWISLTMQGSLLHQSDRQLVWICDWTNILTYTFGTDLADRPNWKYFSI